MLSSIFRRMIFASFGPRPFVEIMTCNGPCRICDPKKKSQHGGSSATFTGIRIMRHRAAMSRDESTVTAFATGTIAKLLAQIGHSGEDEEVRRAFEQGSKWADVKATSRSVGVLFPEEGEEVLGGQWISVVQRETVVPARRTISLNVDLGEAEGEKKVGFEVWEVKEGIKVDKVKPPKEEEEEPLEEEEEEEEEEIEVKEKTIEKDSFLTSVGFSAQHATKIKGRWQTKVDIQFVIGSDGGIEVSAWEVGKAGRGEKASSSVPPLQ
ncbi:hypothetical protein EWM64_g5370 [Hericium alpestre]|uniref:Uncharacterized protein n=1 Tax=Hericium alpestre TaxID=135208 RepID=A0A4Y9ZX93_9AGAM|nr:hypothetical protein EWM64_g5370 [Hericium alpestre]